MPTQKSPEEIVREYTTFHRQILHGLMPPSEVHNWLRESLTSYALYLEGKVNEKRKFDCDRDVCLCEGASADDRVFNHAIDECTFIIRNEAEEAMKGV